MKRGFSVGDRNVMRTTPTLLFAILHFARTRIYRQTGAFLHALDALLQRAGMKKRQSCVLIRSGGSAIAA
jgi:hypothetical protein